MHEAAIRNKPSLITLLHLHISLYHLCRVESHPKGLDFQLSTLDIQPPTTSTPLLPLTSPVSIWRGGSAGGAKRRIEGKRLMNNPFDTLLQAKGRENWLNLDENYIKGARSFAAMDLLHASGSKESCTYVWSVLDCDSELKGSTREQQIYMISFFFLLTFFRHASWYYLHYFFTEDTKSAVPPRSAVRISG